jgi:hypothetical protein
LIIIITVRFNSMFCRTSCCDLPPGVAALVEPCTVPPAATGIVSLFAAATLRTPALLHTLLLHVLARCCSIGQELCSTTSSIVLLTAAPTLCTPALPHILLLYLVARCCCIGQALCSTTSSWLLLLISWRALLAGGGCSAAWAAGGLWLLLWLAGAAQSYEKWCCCALS